ncbi:hypothetical protein [Francisella adeliensis]|uniref:hypothetical protein n=1 Tax=Francisella adeliensis TaxID=2007306 RepID=UPI001908D5AC|nr:hypothetical protein [Francisella adeliensis]MBK2096877.1 hypothetical protein [Francisella adeliensis]QIW13252.1 hypothetical protein FZC44_01365 [Francisella adeliensis]
MLAFFLYYISTIKRFIRVIFIKNCRERLKSNENKNISKIYIKKLRKKVFFIMLNPSLVWNLFLDFLSLFKELVSKFDNLEIKVFAGINILILYVGFIYGFLYQSLYNVSDFISLNLFDIYKFGLEAFFQVNIYSDHMYSFVLFLYFLIFISLEIFVRILILERKSGLRIFPKIYYLGVVTIIFLFSIILIKSYLLSRESNKIYQMMLNGNIATVFSDNKYNYVSDPEKAYTYLVPLNKNIQNSSNVEKYGVLHISYNDALIKGVVTRIKENKKELESKVGEKKYNQILKAYQDVS